MDSYEQLLQKAEQELPERSEGDLTSMRSVIVQKSNLAMMAKSIELSGYLYLGKGEKDSDGANRDSTLCDAFEALIGAIYLDSDLSSVSNLVHELIKDSVSEISKSHKVNNSKGLLQELVHKKFNTKPEYVVDKIDGSEHAPTFYISLFIKNEKVSEGIGNNKKLAEMDAAAKAVQKLQEAWDCTKSQKD